MFDFERLAISEYWLTRYTAVHHPSCKPELKKAIRDLEFLVHSLKINLSGW